MARYTGPVCRLCSRHGDALMLKGERCYTKCAFQKRPQPPGYRLPRRRRVSDRAMQLREKQRARYTYGVLERQFRRYYAEAVRRPGVTGDNLVRLLESRLDNVVYRLGFADSRAQARQLVNHGHLAINGRKTGIPSALVKAGDVVGWTESGKKTEYFKIVQETVTNKEISPWVVLDKETMMGRVLRAPEIAEAGIKFDPLVIVEYYSR